MVASATFNHRTEVISLFRALLRASTYLPDAQARIYVWPHVVTRFRENKSKTSRTEECRKNWVGEARQSLRILQNANNGKLLQLQKVLFYSYGRAGKRRHELLKPLLEYDHPHLARHPNDDPQKSPPGNKQHGRAVIRYLAEQATQVECPSDFIPKLPPRLTALLESQVSANLPDFARPSVGRRLLRLKLPDKNGLGRSFPRRRVPNVIRNWYGSVLERALPPLPAEEWHRLSGLITGKVPWEGPRKRRPGNEIPGVRGCAPSEIVLDRALKLAPKEPKPSSPKDGCHRLTLRFMQRLWMNVFSICPLMRWDLQSSTWKIQWGRQSMPKRPLPAIASDSNLFAGVDRRGKVVTKRVEVSGHPTLSSSDERFQQLASSGQSSLSPNLVSTFPSPPPV